MTASTKSDPRQRRLLEIDSEVEEVKEAFEQALDQLAQRSDLAGSVQMRLAEVGRRLSALKPSLDAADLSVEQKATLYSALVDVNAALNSDGNDLDSFEAILIGIERVRHVVRDALDEFVGGGDADRRRLLEEIEHSLGGVRQADVAALLAVDPRTIRRWGAESGPPTHRLTLVANLIAVLRHAWTPKGILAWFHRSRRDLGDRPPIDLLDEPGSERRLLSAARSSRNQYGT